MVIAGGGPTGLMLAAELAWAGIDVVIVERRASQGLDGWRAGGLHARTIEVLDQRGIGERFLSAGQEHPNVGYSLIMLDISDFLDQLVDRRGRDGRGAGGRHASRQHRHPWAQSDVRPGAGSGRPH